VAVLRNGLRRQGRKQLLFHEPEEEYKQREVCSPDFFKNLNAKYQAEKKERDDDGCVQLQFLLTYLPFVVVNRTSSSS
jgi:hypothetical protein